MVSSWSWIRGNRIDACHVVLLLGFAPFFPQPHIVEKVRMLMAGTLKRPIDIFDLFWHAWPFVLLAVRIVRDLTH